MPRTRAVEGIGNRPFQVLLDRSSEAGVEKLIAPPGMFTRRTSTPFK